MPRHSLSISSLPGTTIHSTLAVSFSVGALESAISSRSLALRSVGDGVLNQDLGAM